MQLSVEPNPRVGCRVVHLDEHFMAIYKPAGVVTQPGGGNERNTLLNFAFAEHGAKLQNLGKRRDFGLLHRLDKPTSGLVLVALTIEGYAGIRAQFEARTIIKTYVTLVHGQIRPPKGRIEAPIREARRGGRKQGIVGTHPHAQEAATRYRTLTTGAPRGGTVSLLECEPETGKLHQIRAHMAWRRHAVVGDRDYGARSELDRSLGGRRVFLHAGGLQLQHPVASRRVTLRAPLPEKLQTFLETLGIQAPRKWR